MPVNLLPHATVKEEVKTQKSLKGLVIFVVWMGILIAVFVLLFLRRGYEQGRLTNAETARTNVIVEIAKLGSKQDDYYSLAYKTLVLSKIKTQQYVPSIIGDYLKAHIENRGTVQQYYFDAEGEVGLQVQTDSYFTAVSIWHDLLKDKTIIQELNLNSFSQAANGAVSFTLKGKLNLEELYRRNGS